MVARGEFLSYINKLLTEEDKAEVKKTTRGYLIGGIVLMIIGAIVALFAVINGISGMGIVPLFIGVVVLIIGLSLILTRKTQGFSAIQNKYKTQVVNYALQGETFQFDQHGIISRRIYQEARLPMDYDIYEGEDLLCIAIPNNEGKPTDVKLIIGDVKTIRIEQDEEGREQRYTLYNGVLGCITFPFNFKCAMTINRHNYAFGMGLEKVELEGIEFNKKFAIKASDQIEARYILTTDVMQKLDKIAQHIRDLGLVFHGNKMFITFPKNKLFNVKVNGKEINGGVFESFYDDIEVIMSLIKEIQENDKVFKLD